MKALIVDDEKDIGLMVSKFLTKEGLEAEYVSTITNARKKIDEEDYSVFFLDLHLPDGTGFDLVPQIKQTNKDSKVIVISAYDGREETQQARELGISTFIKKPFSRQQVLEAIDDIRN